MRRSQRPRLKRQRTRSRADRPLAAAPTPRDAACEFPDRSAARRRRRARIVGAVLLAGAILLPWAAYRPMQAWLQGAAPAADTVAPAMPAAPPAAGAPLSPAADDAASPAPAPALAPASSPEPAPAPAAVAGDSIAPKRPPALALTVRGHAVAREAARSAAAGLPGVRSVGWLDRTRLYAVVEHDGLRGPAQIAAICAALAAHGDAREVEVDLQGAARRSPPLRARCGAVPAAARGASPAATGTPPLPQSPSPPVDAQTFEARNAEAMRILKDTTPEM